MAAALLTCGLMLFFILGSVRYWGPEPTRGHFVICSVAGIAGAMLAFVAMTRFFPDELAAYSGTLSFVMALAGGFVAVAGMLRVGVDDENEPSPG